MASSNARFRALANLGIIVVAVVVVVCSASISVASSFPSPNALTLSSIYRFFINAPRVTRLCADEKEKI
jgi:hypothetical protein